MAHIYNLVNWISPINEYDSPTSTARLTGLYSIELNGSYPASEAHIRTVASTLNDLKYHNIVSMTAAAIIYYINLCDETLNVEPGNFDIIKLCNPESSDDTQVDYHAAFKGAAAAVAAAEMSESGILPISISSAAIKAYLKCNQENNEKAFTACKEKKMENVNAMNNKIETLLETMKDKLNVLVEKGKKELLDAEDAATKAADAGVRCSHDKTVELEKKVNCIVAELSSDKLSNWLITGLKEEFAGEVARRGAMEEEVDTKWRNSELSCNKYIKSFRIHEQCIQGYMTDVDGEVKFRLAEIKKVEDNKEDRKKIDTANKGGSHKRYDVYSNSWLSEEEFITKYNSPSDDMGKDEDDGDGDILWSIAEQPLPDLLQGEDASVMFEREVALLNILYR